MHARGNKLAGEVARLRCSPRPSHGSVGGNPGRAPEQLVAHNEHRLGPSAGVRVSCEDGVGSDDLLVVQSVVLRELMSLGRSSVRGTEPVRG